MRIIAIKDGVLQENATSFRSIAEYLHKRQIKALRSRRIGVKPAVFKAINGTVIYISL